jgi:hypothetical protein
MPAPLYRLIHCHLLDYTSTTLSTNPAHLLDYTSTTFATIPPPLSRYTAATSRLSVAMSLIPVTDAHGSTDYYFRRCHKCRFLSPPIDRWHLSCHLLDASESLPAHQSDFHRGRYIHRHDLSYPRYHWSFHVIAPMGPILMQPHITTLTSNSPSDYSQQLRPSYYYDSTCQRVSHRVFHRLSYSGSIARICWAAGRNSVSI